MDVQSDVPLTSGPHKLSLQRRRDRAQIMSNLHREYVPGLLGRLWGLDRSDIEDLCWVSEVGV